ncbi:FmdE family protein [Desulfatiferula olefinivorans]
MHTTNHPLPDDLAECVRFHGHLCPGLVYGYLVAKEAINRLGIGRSADEEVVAVIENDSCAVDGIQVMLGATAGKGNLIIRNYGKNVFTIQSRKTGKALRFSRVSDYRYQGDRPDEFEPLERKMAEKIATPGEMKRQKKLKALDLMNRECDQVFTITDTAMEPIGYAPLAPSRACARCGELTMQSRMVSDGNERLLCVPCASALGVSPGF